MSRTGVLSKYATGICRPITKQPPPVHVIEYETASSQLVIHVKYIVILQLGIY